MSVILNKFIWELDLEQILCFKKKKKKKKGRNWFLDVILKILNQINQLIIFYNVAFQDSIIGIEEEICLS